MDSITIKIIPYLETSFDVIIKHKRNKKLIDKKAIVVHTETGSLVIDDMANEVTPMETKLLEILFADNLELSK